MSLNWTTVKSLAIPVGGVSRDVKRVSIGGAVVWEKPSPLPYDAEVEYLESTGTQYIDSNVEASVDVDVVLNAGVPSNAYNALFGAWAASSDSIRYSLNVGSGNDLFYCTINASNATTALPTSPFMVSRIGNSVIVGSVQKTLSNVQSASWGGRTLWIFGVNRGSTVNLSANGTRVYACKIYVAGVLVRDYIPVRVGTTGYLYDRVSGQLFGNAGTGAFGYGRDTNPISARSYVKDGLVCHMNCREGDFLDLTGNVTRTDTGTVEVTRNGAVYASGVSSALSGLTTSADCSWEFVFTSPETTGNNVVVFNGRTTVDGATTGIDLLFSYLSGTGLRYRIWAASWASGLATFTPNTPQAFGFVRGAGVRESYIRGGNYVQSRSQNDFVPNPNGTAVIKGPVRFYDIRVYNRMLTADEAAINYTVDKALFNVP